MLHPHRIAILAQHLSSRLPDPARRRRRDLLGAVLEKKAATGAFDLELLHHWLDVAIAGQADRALFGLGKRAGPAAVPRIAARRSDRVSGGFPPEDSAMNSTTPHSPGPAHAR